MLFATQHENRRLSQSSTAPDAIDPSSSSARDAVSTHLKSPRACCCLSVRARCAVMVLLVSYQETLSKSTTDSEAVWARSLEAAAARSFVARIGCRWMERCFTSRSNRYAPVVCYKKTGCLIWFGP
jgi:hypothetical protein